MSYQEMMSRLKSAKLRPNDRIWFGRWVDAYRRFCRCSGKMVEPAEPVAHSDSGTQPIFVLVLSIAVLVLVLVLDPTSATVCVCWIKRVSIDTIRFKPDVPRRPTVNVESLVAESRSRRFLPLRVRVRG